MIQKRFWLNFIANFVYFRTFSMMLMTLCWVVCVFGVGAVELGENNQIISISTIANIDSSSLVQISSGDDPPHSGIEIKRVATQNAHSIQQTWNSAQSCPMQEDMLPPCICNGTKREILCRGSSTDADARLQKSFRQLAKLMAPKQRAFSSVYINMRGLVRLDSGVFSGIQFDTVFISGNNLTYIASDAFYGTEQSIKSMYIHETNLSNSQSSNIDHTGEKYDFFAALRTLPNLRQLVINQNNLTKIPDRAFAWPDDPVNVHNRTQARSQLTEFQIANSRIEVIGHDAFADLAHLRQLTLAKNAITTIRSYAFRMNNPSRDRLLVDLSNNRLNHKSFDINAFAEIQRPVKIHFGLDGCNRDLRFLPENIFRSFLDAHRENTIDAGRACVHYQCDCRMAWALETKYRYRVKNYRCMHRQELVYFDAVLSVMSCRSSDIDERYSQQHTPNITTTSTIAKDTAVNINIPEPIDNKAIDPPANSNMSIVKQDSDKLPEVRVVEKTDSKPVLSPVVNTTSVISETVNATSKNKNNTESSSNAKPLIEQEQYCMSKKCIKQGLEMNNYLNRTVDPCESFYDFACNGWQNNHLLEYLVQMLSNGGSEYDNFVKAQLTIQENFGKLLTSEQKSKLLVSSGVVASSQQSKSPLSTYATTASVTDTETDSSNNDLINRRQSTADSLLPVINTKTMYGKCLSAPRGQNYEGLNKILADIGGWPMLDKKFDAAGYRWEQYFDTIVNRYHDRIFIEIETAVDENVTKHLMIKSGSFIVSLRKLLSVKLNRLENYATYMLNTALHFGAKNFQNETWNEIWNVIRFEKLIADIARKSTGNEYLIERKLETIGCLIPEMNWLQILNSIQRRHRVLNELNFVRSKATFNIHYLIDLSRLLARTDPRTIANYLGWRVVESMGFLIGGTAFIDIQQNFYSTESKEGTKNLKNQCLEPLTRAMPYLMSRMYLDKYFPVQAQQNARIIVESVKQSFIESMMTKTLTKKAKDGLIARIQNINMNIGYPEWILDDQNLENFYILLNYTVNNTDNMSEQLLEFYTKVQEVRMLHMFTNLGEQVNKSHFWNPLPLHVGATYDFVGNIITIPMGLLQPPFYEDGRPYYVNFASLGSFFGHEMSHSVTPRYSEFDELLPPWTSQLLKEYLYKAQCFVSQYSSYYDKSSNMHLDGTRTFEEDMSDLAGIQAAFNAFQNHNKKTHKILGEQKLQDLPEFSTDMLFFLSFAQKWCRSNTHVQTRIRISKSVHSPEKYRVNGALSNLEAFSVAFNCTPGSPMNPVKKCESW